MSKSGTSASGAKVISSISSSSSTSSSASSFFCPIEVLWSLPQAPSELFETLELVLCFCIPKSFEFPPSPLLPKRFESHVFVCVSARKSFELTSCLPLKCHKNNVALFRATSPHKPV